MNQSCPTLHAHAFNPTLDPSIWSRLPVSLTTLEYRCATFRVVSVMRDTNICPHTAQPQSNNLRDASPSRSHTSQVRTTHTAACGGSRVPRGSPPSPANPPLCVISTAVTRVTCRASQVRRSPCHWWKQSEIPRPVMGVIVPVDGPSAQRRTRAR